MYLKYLIKYKLCCAKSEFSIQLTEIMSSCEIIANYRQLPTIGFHQKLVYYLLITKLGYLALVCIHLRVCYRHIATSEKKQLRQPGAEIIICSVCICLVSILIQIV